MKIQVMCMRRMLYWEQRDWNDGKVDGVISIRTPDSEMLGNYPPELDESIDRVTPNKLIIICHDVTVPSAHWVQFHEGHAEQILEFVEGKQHLIIHCDAGMSRSVAVGAFLRDYFGAQVVFLEGYGDGRKNILVYNTLRRVGDFGPSFA